jgi:hypothetical protein
MQDISKGLAYTGTEFRYRFLVCRFYETLML